MEKLLKIAITADPEIAVPPVLYGGIERIIDMLINGYVQRGHHVSLFAHKDSVTKADLYPYAGPTSTNKLDFLKNSWTINRTLVSKKFDIIHSFGRLAYLLPQLPFTVPKIMSYQREPTLSQIKKALKISAPGSLVFTGCSNYISEQIAPYAPSYTIYNGVPLSTYKFVEKVGEDAPLVFLGRIEPIKGTHLAIEVAKRSGRRLLIAGNIPKEHQLYFEEKIAPYLDERIQYVGPVNDTQKNELLGKAVAFLMPIMWNEPFGIVMAEAMACGTPVIGFARGAVKEVVINQKNGFVCKDIEEMTELVAKAETISRAQVRKDAEERFASEVIIDEYLNLYYQLLRK